jgi:hypothetical protein
LTWLVDRYSAIPLRKVIRRKYGNGLKLSVFESEIGIRCGTYAARLLSVFSVQLASRGPKGELTGQSVSSDYQLDLQLDVNANGMVDLSVQELPHLKATIARNLDLRVDKTLTDAFDRFRLAFHSPSPSCLVLLFLCC